MAEFNNTIEGVFITGTAEVDVITSSGNYSTLDGGKGDDEISNMGTDSTVYGGASDDTVYNNGENSYVDGGNGDDDIDNSGDGSTAYGGAGDDYVDNYGENSYVDGGSGNDTVYFDDFDGRNVYQYASGDGNDKIFGFTSYDTLNIAGTYSTAVSGSNVIVTVGKGKITLSGAASLDNINISATLKLTNSSKSAVTLSSVYNDADASSRTKAIRITGNALDNEIVGGTGNDKLYGDAGYDMLYGGNGNDSLYGGDDNDYIEGGAGNDKLYGDTGYDTLYGGAGNDSLWGGDGDYLFIYNAGEGKDYIFGFEDYDTLSLDGLEFTATYSKKNAAVTLKFDDGSIVLKNFTATTFHIDNDTYQISGTKLVKD